MKEALNLKSLHPKSMVVLKDAGGSNLSFPKGKQTSMATSETIFTDADLGLLSLFLHSNLILSLFLHSNPIFHSLISLSGLQMDSNVAS